MLVTTMDICQKDMSDTQFNNMSTKDTHPNKNYINIPIKDNYNEEKKDSIKKKKKKKIRCIVCKKNLGINPFVCKCEQNFCGLHRLPESHICSYNFKEAGIKKLSKNLVKVAPIKIAII